MSAIIYLPGRPTSDPQIMQSKNGSTTYTTLDIACPQRGADGKKETVFYSCYFNSFQADRLVKAGVKKSTGLIIIGDLELHPFIHQKGKNQGHPNAGPSVIVKDWQFAPASYDENSGANPGGPGGMPQNGNGQGAYQNNYGPQGGYQTSGPQNGYQQSGQMQGGSYPASGRQPQNGYQPAQPNGHSQQGAGTNYGQPQQNGYQQPNPMAGQSAPPQQNNGYMPPNGVYGGMQGGNPGDGFSHVPEHQAGNLPFAA